MLRVEVVMLEVKTLYFKVYTNCIVDFFLL
jgi:hypothetical protein